MDRMIFFIVSSHLLLLDELPVELLVASSNFPDLVMGLNSRSGALAKFVPFLSGQVYHPLPTFGKGVGIPRRDDDAGFADNFRGVANVGCHTWHTASHGLTQHVWKGFANG